MKQLTFVAFALGIFGMSLFCSPRGIGQEGLLPMRGTIQVGNNGRGVTLISDSRRIRLATADTRIYIRDNQGQKAPYVDGLKSGQHVEVYVVPVFFATDPPIAAAREIVILDDKANADIRGIVKSIFAAKKTGAVASVLVEGPKGQPYDKASIRVTADTKIFKLEGKERKAAKFEDLKVGMLVEAKFVGPVAESYPVQAKAGEIVILAEKK